MHKVPYVLPQISPIYKTWGRKKNNKINNCAAKGRKDRCTLYFLPPTLTGTTKLLEKKIGTKKQKHCIMYYFYYDIPFILFINSSKLYAPQWPIGSSKYRI